MTDTRRRATLRDVAEHADVSISTVSKVLNERHDVGPAVRQRVLDTIRQLEYRPNSVARGLRMQRSNTIALVSDDLEGIFTSALMRGVEDAAAEAEVAVLLCNTYGDPAKEEMHLRRLLDKQVDGLIFMSGNRVGPRSAPAAPIPSSVPYLYLYEYGVDDSVTSVLPDDYGGARLAIAHLAEQGARRILFLNGPEEWEATQDRLHGFRDGLASAALVADPRYELGTGSWAPDDGYDRISAFLEGGLEFDAVFCASDDLATGALAALHDRKIDVPRDVLVVGFDDRSLALHQRPPLSSVALPLAEMGETAGSLLLAAIEGNPPPGGIVRVPCELRARESSRR